MADYKLKIRRFDPESGEPAYWGDYDVDLPPERSVLDGILQVKDREDASIGIRCSCRAAICGSCGVRINGKSALACNTRIGEAAERSRDGAITIEPMGNMPVVKDLNTDMEAVHWKKVRRVVPWLLPAEAPPERSEYIVPAEAMLDVTQAMACIHCGVCVSACLSMEVDPHFVGPAALAKGMRFVGDARDRATVERLQSYSSEHGIWDCTRCYFCQERCPKGVDPRDAIAKLGAEAMKAGIDRDMGAKHAKWFVTSAKTTGWLRETELVPKTQGVVKAIKEIKFAMSLLPKGKVPVPFPPHVAADVGESRALFDLVKDQGLDGAAGIVQGEKALQHLAHHGETVDGPSHPYDDPRSFPKPYLPEEEPVT